MYRGGVYPKQQKPMSFTNVIYKNAKVVVPHICYLFYAVTSIIFNDTPDIAEDSQHHKSESNKTSDILKDLSIIV